MHVVVESGRPRPAEVAAGAPTKRRAQQHNVKNRKRSSASARLSKPVTQRGPLRGTIADATSLQAAWHSALPLKGSV
jgi:hypothetical protein